MCIIQWKSLEYLKKIIDQILHVPSLSNNPVVIHFAWFCCCPRGHALSEVYGISITIQTTSHAALSVFPAQQHFRNRLEHMHLHFGHHMTRTHAAAFWTSHGSNTCDCFLDITWAAINQRYAIVLIWFNMAAVVCKLLSTKKRLVTKLIRRS